MRARPKEPDATFATTLANGLDILASMPADGSGITNSGLAERLGLTRPTVSRLCATLLTLGYLERGPDRRYLAGRRVLALAYPMLSSMRIRVLARPLLRDFAEHCQGNVSLVVMDGLCSLNVETVRMFDGANHVPEIGMQVPLEQGSSGRALLSLLPAPVLNLMLQDIAASRPESWSRCAEQVAEGLQSCRQRGFCLALGSYDPGLFAVGAPIAKLASGHLLAVNCGMPSYKVNAADLENRWGPRLAALAQGIRSLAEVVEGEPVSDSSLDGGGQFPHPTAIG